MAQAIRNAEPGDVDAIVAVVHAAYQQYVASMDRLPAPMSADYGVLIDQGAVTVMTDHDQVVGVLVAWVTNEPDGRSFYVDNVAVAPAHTGSGIGRALLAEADDLARRAGCHNVWLYTNEAMTNNIGYYQRLGFEEFDRRIDDGYARVFFRRPLGRARSAVRPGE